MFYIGFKYKHTFTLIILVLIVINFASPTHVPLRKRDVVACKSCLDGCCGNAKTVDDYNNCFEGCFNGPNCQGVSEAYQCNRNIPTGPTGNVDACNNCLNGCCGNAKTKDDFNNC